MLDLLRTSANRASSFALGLVSVAHETVGVIGAALRDGCAVVIVDEAHAVDAVQEVEVVLLVLENHLMVDFVFLLRTSG